jgi:hypothetical protein
MKKNRWAALLLLSALASPCVRAACIDAGIENLHLQENVAALDAQLSTLVAKKDRSRTDILLLGLAAYRT